jgi:co-chaperonin GroES (HSP10)
MFEPVNRYILIDVKKETETQSLIVLPEDYKAKEERFVSVKFLKAASDVRFDIPNDCNLIVDNSMIEEINVRGTNYNVILDNYVVGIT